MPSPPQVLALAEPMALNERRGTAEVDAALLADIGDWRSDLARNVARRNPGFPEGDLSFAVQQIIDRILFLRLAEDRGLEDYGRLQAITNGAGVYSRLTGLFQDADARYHSGLFDFEREGGWDDPPDELTLKLSIDDAVLRGILRRLYDPESPYKFAVLPADTLGQVYERFLGTAMASGHRARFDDKPVVKKAGGVYYTPAYIVDYVVQQTVGKLLEGRTPKEVAKLKILDPACGSGSFLIGAYQYLLDWHRDWYVADGPEKHRKELYVVGTHRVPSLEYGTRSVPTTLDYRLTTAERRRILLSSIYGVDIDRQAVEVTKLSLLLQALDGTSHESIERQPPSLHPQAVPDLGSNIKCGNSLIGPDFYDDQPRGLPSEEERHRINAFDWHGQQGFPEILRAGGFDAVIGNPPYVNVRILGQVQGQRVKDYFARAYACAERGYDLYVLFLEKSLRLLKGGGIGGMIVPNKIGTLEYGRACRWLLLATTTLLQIVDLSRFRLFARASVYPYILVWQKQPPARDHSIHVIEADSAAALHSGRGTTIKQARIDATSGFTIHGELAVEKRVATAELAKRAQLDSGATGFAAEQLAGELRERTSQGKGAFEFIVSGNIDRYRIALGDVRFMKRRFKRPCLPTDAGILTDRKKQLYAATKIVIAGMTRRIEAALDPSGLALGVQVFAASQLADDPLYILGILNSRLISYLFRLRFPAKRLAGGFLAINRGQLAKLPIRLFDGQDDPGRVQRDALVALVGQMLDLHARLAAARSSLARTKIERRIEATDRQIDQLVYQFYGLTTAEIALVEAAK